MKRNKKNSVTGVAERKTEKSWSGSADGGGGGTAAAAGDLEQKMPAEVNGPKGPEPTRYGDWEQKGRCTDF